MSFTNRPQPSASFTNRDLPGRVVGDMSEDDWVTLLGFSPTFDTPIPQAGYKLFGDLTFEDVVIVSTFVQRSQPSATFTNRATP